MSIDELPAALHLQPPQTDLVSEAANLARLNELPAIYHHSVRTFVHARTSAGNLGLRPATDFDEEELYVACILHDLGTADAYNGSQRFEVDGADAAVSFLASRDIGCGARDRIWEAIVLHTSPGIAERFRPLTRLLRAGVLADFGGPTALDVSQTTSLETAYPRSDIEHELSAAVVRQALAEPRKAPASSWPADLLRAHVGATAVRPGGGSHGPSQRRSPPAR